MGINIDGAAVLADEHRALIVMHRDGGPNWEIDLAAIASWGELLGIDDPGEVLDAIMHVHTHGQPDPDPVTGENAWTPAYEALARARQVEAAEQITAHRQGTAEDPRSPKLRGMLAALPARSELNDARAETRRRLGLDNPAPAIQRMAATSDPEADPEPDPMAELRARLREPDLDRALTALRASFLAHLAPDPEPQEAGQ